MGKKKVIRVGTRGSDLAITQTEQVIAALTKRFPEWEMEQVILRTQGDRILDKPLIDFGGKGAFITEFEEALLSGQIDLAVHSAKDMPVNLADGLEIAGVLPRADVRDVLITAKGALAKMDSERSGKQTLQIGTGSLRRQFQLKTIYPELQCVSIRGNVPTRLQKISGGKVDGVVLAVSGLERLGLLGKDEFDYRYFSCEEMVPAGGQGIIAIEGCSGSAASKMIKEISDRRACYELETEREVLRLLEAGCHEAIGVLSQVDDREIALHIVKEKNGVMQEQKGKAVLADRLRLAKRLVDEL